VSARHAECLSLRPVFRQLRLNIPGLNGSRFCMPRSCERAAGGVISEGVGRDSAPESEENEDPGSG
jgi:hypothetical protein